MRTMRILLVMLLSVIAFGNVSAQKKKAEKTVVFHADLHCESCKAKIEKNIPFEKGVKDLKVDMKSNTITVTFREDKNTEENLKQAIEKLDIKVKDSSVPAAGKTSCCETGHKHEHK